MPIHRLIPNAGPDDPAWDLSLNQGVVVVRAQSSGEARAVAALEEAAARAHAVPQTTTQVVASAFRDDKLYTVVEDHSGVYPAAGQIGLVRGSFHFPEEFVPLKAD
jgi:hypothetical protein